MKKPKIHLICTAHLDPVWQWQWEEGCAETLTTFRVAVQLLHEFPEFIFTHNESVLYRWVEMYDPALFRAIKKLIKQKRWVIGGGWFLQPDLNIPDTESILRQIIEGRRYFYNKFQVTPKVAYNFDVFGHSSGLPQILRLTGYEMYLHMRPQPDQLKLPADLYRWRGIEGTEIPAYRPPFGFYHHETGNLAELLAQGIELALALDYLYETNKKIIFTSCYLPTDIPKLSDSLRSRISSGLISNIDPPNFATRVRILRKKAKQNNLKIPSDVIDYLASELTENVRQLESGLFGIAAKSSLLGVPIDVSLAESVVKTIARQQKAITVEVIKKLVCQNFNLSIKEIISTSRKQQIVRPRQIAIFLARRYTDQPLQSIGKSFNRQHATAIHAINAVENAIKAKGPVKRQVEYLSQKLESGKF